MPWGLILIVAGLVVYFVTTYATLGVILTVIGILLVVIQIVVMLIAVFFFNKKRKKFDREFDSFNRRGF